MQGGLCMKSCDRSPRVKEMRCLTNFVIESLHILILTVVGAAKHGDHTCTTNIDSFHVENSLFVSTVQHCAVSNNNMCQASGGPQLALFPLSWHMFRLLLSQC